jgi:molecular chaperone HscB
MTTDAVKCWSCGKERAATDALCSHCGKIQPPPAFAAGEERVIDKFAVLGLPRLFDLHPTRVEETYKLLSRKLHPDRFARAVPLERRFSLEQTTLLNDAYRTLKEPVRRAEHLLELRGVRVGEGSKIEMGPEFLEQAMDDREKLLAAKEEGGDKAVLALAAGVRKKRDETMTHIAQALRALEAGEKPPELASVAQKLAQLRYYARYLDQVEGRPPEL